VAVSSSSLCGLVVFDSALVDDQLHLLEQRNLQNSTKGNIYTRTNRWSAAATLDGFMSAGYGGVRPDESTESAHLLDRPFSGFTGVNHFTIVLEKRLLQTISDDHDA